MKHYQNHLPAVLLLAYCIYSAFIPVTIAHSLIFLSLAILAGYQSHISRSETTKYNQKVLEQMKNDFETKLNGTKEFYDKKLSKLEDEVAKLALNTIPTKVSTSSPIPRKVMF